MRTRRGATIASLMVGTGLALALTAAPAPAMAQDEEPDCRCVDRDGNEIEGCTCFRGDRLRGLAPRFEMIMPRLEGLERHLQARAPRIAVFGDRRARLGISIRVAEPSASDTDGAEVSDVLEGGPADDAGIQAGDVITHVDGRSLAEPLSAEQERDLDLDASIPAQRLLTLARELEPGESVEVRYLRDGQPQTTMVEARELSGSWGVRFPTWDRERRGEARERMRDAQERMRDDLERLRERSRSWRFRDDPEGTFFFRGDDPDGGDVHVLRGPGGRFFLGGSGAAAGLELVEVSPALGAYFDVDEGVLVTAVSPSSTLGLEPGDVVVAVGEREVRTPDGLRRILSSYTEDEEIELHIVRNGEERVLTAPMRQ